MPEKKKETQKRQKLYNEEAEKSLLGCFMLDNEKAYSLHTGLKETDFYVAKNRLIFIAMVELMKKNVPIDIVTLVDKLEAKGQLEEAGGLEYVTEVNTFVPTAASVKQYFAMVKRDATMRELTKAAQDIGDIALEAEDSEVALNKAEKAIFDLSQGVGSSELVHVRVPGEQVLERFEKLKNDKNAFRGFPIKEFPRLDETLQGLHHSNLIILAARPACGKTAFAMNLAAQVAFAGGVVAVFSLEMSSVELVQRMVCAEAKVSISAATRGYAGREDNFRICEVERKLQQTELYIDENAGTQPTDILSKCSKLKREHQNRLDLVVVDYLGLMKSDIRSESRQEQVSDLSRSMKIISKELDAPILLLCQLNRNAELQKKDSPDKEPQLTDLRDSGAIEQDADIVMFLNNPFKVEPGEEERDVDLIIAKHRNGPTAKIAYRFYNGMVRFKEKTVKEEKEDKDKRKNQPDGGEESEESTDQTDVQTVDNDEQAQKMSDFAAQFNASTESEDVPF